MEGSSFASPSGYCYIAGSIDIAVVQHTCTYKFVLCTSV